MDIVLALKALILGLVEGLTEFLPISSTGHLIIMGNLLGGFSDARGKVFEIVIQLGAILAVVWEFRAKLGVVTRGLVTRDPTAWRFASNVLVAFMPAVVLGLLFHDVIKTYLFNPYTVAMALIVGGVIILWVEKRAFTPRVHTIEEMSWQDALKVGFAQSVAMFPGVSRSGATIIGGMMFGMNRSAATAFSFFLAIPTMFAATVYDLYKNWALLSVNDVPLFVIGFVAAFISAYLAVAALLKFVSNHTFVGFAWYRIIFGILVLLSAYTGVVNWSTN
ncbi:MAG: undecaprenyl-diphosphate phosphatase [Sulfuriferula sp.]